MGYLLIFKNRNNEETAKQIKKFTKILFLIYLENGLPEEKLLSVLESELNNGKSLSLHFNMMDKEMKNKIFWG